ncbi:MAG TPA: shikimate kinase [Chitinophagaceae bacterium]|nr:shikimate kinase [Chitinophagaceae bacterium]
MRIFLIGFMGSGKTHWGKLLSQHTGMPYFDLDEVIVAAEKKSIQQIFHDNGEEYFRIKEQEVLEALAEDHDNVIIATGGGTPCFFNNIDFMRQQGKVIWLNTSVDILLQRLLKQKHSRPLIKNISDHELKAYIIKKLQDRKMYYEQAHIMLHEEQITIQSLVNSLEHA